MAEGRLLSLVVHHSLLLLLRLTPSLVSEPVFPGFHGWLSTRSFPGPLQGFSARLGLLKPQSHRLRNYQTISLSSMLLWDSPNCGAPSLKDQVTTRFSASQVWFSCCYCFEVRWLNTLYIYNLYLYIYIYIHSSYQFCSSEPRLMQAFRRHLRYKPYSTALSSHQRNFFTQRTAVNAETHN